MNLTVFAGILLAVTMVTARRASLGEKTKQAAGKADERDEAMKEAARPAKLVDKIMRAATEAEKPDETKRESGGSYESTPEESEMDGSLRTGRQADGTDGIPVSPSGIQREFKRQQEEINKLRRLIGCYHGIVKPVVYSGTAGASSTWNSNYAPHMAFENSDERWASESLGDGPRRADLYFNFTSEVAVAQIGFKTPNGYAWDQAPKIFELVASMNCSEWHVLRNVDHHFTTTQEFIWTIPCDRIKPWKCYGIRATAHSGSSYDCVSVKEMKMFTIEGWQKNPDIRPDVGLS